MKFYPVIKEMPVPETLQTEYKNAHVIGVMRIGTEDLFFKAGLRNYFIPFNAVKRCFRRIMSVPAKMCCGTGNFSVDSIVIGDADHELAEIQMPGTKAAKLAMEELKNVLPHADFSAPKKAAEETPSVEGA